METKLNFIIIAILNCLILVESQENAGTGVAPALRECYNTTYLLDRDRRPPSTINVLIDLIRRVEDGPSMLDMREIAVGLLHRFRQDGISRGITQSAHPLSIPFVPAPNQSIKNKYLLTTIVPGNAVNFPNETLNSVEKCSLHFMLSSSIETALRGDESTVCGRIAHYVRRARDVDPNDQVETFDGISASLKKGNMQDESIPSDYDDTDQVEVEAKPRSGVDAFGSATKSDCPVENGAVNTRWGVIQAGTVIAGIASGLEPQTIPVDQENQIDSRFAATISGDIAEAALYQGSKLGSVVTVGANGGWNSTLAPRWYFIEERENWEMTDADIRGGLDGLIMALNIKSWQSSVSSLKLSQLLDMYYSPRGVFDKTYRACNRKALLTTVAPEADLTAQAIAYGVPFTSRATLAATLDKADIQVYVKQAIEKYNSRVPVLNDMNCVVDDDYIQRVATDLIIVLDTQWNYRAVSSALGYLLDALDVNKFGTNFTLLNAKDCSIMVNSSRSILDYHELYNETVQQHNSQGIDYSNVFNQIGEIMKRKMDDDRQRQDSGGKSSIVLLVPHSSAGINTDYINERKEYFKTNVPDLRLLVLGFGQKDAYNDLVFDAAHDIFTMTDSVDSTSVAQSIIPLITRIKQIPRKIVNPRCGSDWLGDSSSNGLDQNIEPNSVNYYRIAPNYFYGHGFTATIKVRGQDSGTLTVCTSRQNAQPRQNTTVGGDVQCQSLSSNEVSLDLSNKCEGYNKIVDCPPYYISVEAAGSSSNNFRCTDASCRFPDDIKFSFATEGLRCGSIRVLNSVILMVLMVVVTRIYF